MILSLTDAARLLGKTPRQVRYLIQHGDLPAEKVNGRWHVKRADLPLSEGAQQARATKIEGALQIAEDVLRKGADTQRSFSVLDLKAFRNGRSLYHRLVAECTPEHPAVGFMKESLMLLSVGCHSFQHRDKAVRYADARAQACRAVVALLVDTEHEDLAKEIECHYLTPLGGLIRRSETRRR